MTDNYVFKGICYKHRTEISNKNPNHDQLDPKQTPSDSGPSLAPCEALPFPVVGEPEQNPAVSELSPGVAKPEQASYGPTMTQPEGDEPEQTFGVPGLGQTPSVAGTDQTHGVTKPEQTHCVPGLGQTLSEAGSEQIHGVPSLWQTPSVAGSELTYGVKGPEQTHAVPGLGPTPSVAGPELTHGVTGPEQTFGVPGLGQTPSVAGPDQTHAVPGLGQTPSGAGSELTHGVTGPDQTHDVLGLGQTPSIAGSEQNHGVTGLGQYRPEPQLTLLEEDDIQTLSDLAPVAGLKRQSAIDADLRFVMTFTQT